MCSAKIGMALKALHNSNHIPSVGTYKGGDYSKLDNATRQLVDEKAEVIWLATRFLSLSSNNLHCHSKQDIKRNMIKGGDNYPRNIVSVLSFLHHHSLPGNGHQDHNGITPGLKETTFTQVVDEEPKKEFENRVSVMWRAFEKEECPYKTQYTWTLCPHPHKNIGPNFGKTCNANGDFVLCTLG